MMYSSRIISSIICFLIVKTIYSIHNPSEYIKKSIKEKMKYLTPLVNFFPILSTTKAATPLKNEWYNPSNERIFDTQKKSFLPTVVASNLIETQLNRKNQRVVVIGEIHSNPCHHRVEFDVVRAFFDANDNMINVVAVNKPFSYAIGLECFYRQHQAALDRYIFDHQNIKTLKQETNWDESWGYDLNYYAKIFNFASKRKIRLLGLNIPYPIAKYVGEIGLENVPPKLKKILPVVDLSNKKHRLQFEEAIGIVRNKYNEGEAGTHNIKALDKMYQVQCLWEDYMSESCSLYLNKYPNSKLCVIAGVGHVKGRVGIPDRIATRTNTRPFVIVPEQVSWSELTGLPDIDYPLEASECDWAWYTEQEIIGYQ